MDHKFSEIDHVTPLFNLFLVVHLPTHSVVSINTRSADILIFKISNYGMSVYLHKKVLHFELENIAS